MIGLGLHDEKDITVKGLEAVRSSSYVFLENYTSILHASVEKLEKFYGKKIILAGRDLVENRSDEILSKAKKENISFLVVGDPMAATTHIDLMLQAKKKKIDVQVIHNASVINAVGMTGLQLYKFGKTTSIPFFEEFYMVETPYNVLKENLKSNLHTLFLLDLDPDKERFMTVNDAIEILLKIENKKKQKIFTEKTMCLGAARLGSEKPLIKYCQAGKMLGYDFGKPPHSLIVPAKKLHFMEEEALEQWEV